MHPPILQWTRIHPTNFSKLPTASYKIACLRTSSSLSTLHATEGANCLHSTGMRCT